MSYIHAHRSISVVRAYQKIWRDWHPVKFNLHLIARAETIKQWNVAGIRKCREDEPILVIDWTHYRAVMLISFQKLKCLHGNKF